MAPGTSKLSPSHVTAAPSHGQALLLLLGSTGGEMGSWEQSDLLPFPVQIPHSLAERAPRKAALSQVNHTQSVLHSLIASFPITYSLCAFTAAQPSPLRP